MRRLNVLIKLSFVTAKKTVKMALMKEQLAVSFFFFSRFMTFFGVKKDNHLSRIPSILQSEYWRIGLDLDPFFGGLYWIVDPFFPEDCDRIVDPKNQGLDRKGSDFFQILFLENMSE